MILFIAIVVILVFSMLLSYLSIKNDAKKGKHVEEVKKGLAKERVIYYAAAHKQNLEKQK